MSLFPCISVWTVQNADCRLTQTIVFRVRKQWDYSCLVFICMVKITASGGSRGGVWAGPAPTPLFLEQTEARRTENNFLGDQAPPYLRIWMTAPSPPYLKVLIRHWGLQQSAVCILYWPVSVFFLGSPTSCGYPKTCMITLTLYSHLSHITFPITFFPCTITIYYYWVDYNYFWWLEAK